MGPIVVGVQSNQPDAVVQQAAQFATLLGTDLICAYVATEIPLAQGLAGSAAALGSGLYVPVETDFDEIPMGHFDPALRDQITSALRPSAVAWRTEYLTGEPADALGRLAEQLDSPMLVVGTREAGPGRTMHDFFTGSTAVHLAHRQHRPVLVIPTHPVTNPEQLPWSTEAHGTPPQENNDSHSPSGEQTDASDVHDPAKV